LVFKVYDSETDGRARFTPHTSFDDPRHAAGILAAPEHRGAEHGLLLGRGVKGAPSSAIAGARRWRRSREIIRPVVHGDYLSVAEEDGHRIEAVVGP